MADIPLFPTEANLESFKDFVNVQKQMNEHLLEEGKLYEKIGRINLNIEDNIVKRRSNEFRLMKDIRDLTVDMNRLLEQRATVQGDADRRKLEDDIQATKELIRYNQELINMSKEASAVEMDMVKQKFEWDNRWYNFASKHMESLFGLKVKEYEVTKGIGEEMIKIGVRTETVAMTFGALLMMLKGAYDRFLQFDKAAWEFRKVMGMTRDEAQRIRASAERMALDFMDVGVTIEGAYKSFQALANSVGGVHNVSTELAKNVSIVAAQLGISEDHSTGFLRNLAAISKNTMESQTNAMYIAQYMSAAAGVPLNEIMGDMATKSNTTLTMMSRLPNVAMKSAIELRRMGTSLDQAAKSSRHILDFTENVNEEMEASVLLGRSINLQRARELAYRRDLEGSTKEIVRLTKSINFESLDVFQQEAFARATGKSVDELLKLVQANRQIEQVRRSGTSEQKAQLALYEKMRSENEAAARARAKDVGLMLQQRANQERITSIQNKWNQLLAKAQSFLFPVIDKLLTGALYLTQWAPQVMAMLNPVSKLFGFVSEIVALFSRVGPIGSRITLAMMNAARYGHSTVTFGEKILLWVGRFAGGISKSLGLFGKLFGVLGKFLGPIGWVITAFQAITGFIQGWNSTTGNIIQKIGGGLVGALRNVIPGFDYIMKALNWVWEKISFAATFWSGTMKEIVSSLWQSIKSVGSLVLDALISPFKAAWSWVKSIWGGNSPSQLGLSILKGITSIGPMLFDALTAPFRKSLAWVLDKIPGLGKVADKLKGGVQGLMNPVEQKAAVYVPAVTVTPNGTKLETGNNKPQGITKAEKEASTPMTEETGQKIVALLEKILAKDVNVHMDGQLLGTTLARSTEFRGGYGVNKVS